MVRLVCLAALALGLAAPLAAQPADALPPLVFDDLSYQAAEWTSLDDRAAAERSLYGLNPWCRSLACGDTLSTRAWYRYLWREEGFGVADTLARIEPDTSGTGTLGFALLAGEHPESFPMQVASGYSARIGVWAARAQFSDLQVRGEPHLMQSFWTLGTQEAIKTRGFGRDAGTRRGRDEMDFEYNNWFEFIPDVPVFMATVSFPNSEAGVRAPLRAAPGAPDYSCQLRTPAAAEPRVGTPAECARFLGEPGTWTTMAIRSLGVAIQFEMSAEGPEGTLRADSGEILGRAPSQRMMAMMSQYFLGTERTLSHDQRVVFDWVYFSPDAARPLDAVRRDVDTIQSARVDGRRVTRLNTAPIRLTRPYRVAADGVWGLARFVPPAVRVEGPSVLATGREADYVVRIDDTIGTFRVAWSQREVSADGTPGPWSTPDPSLGYRYPTRMPRGAACLDVRAEVVKMQYTVTGQGADRVADWVPADADEPMVGVRRACTRGAARALRGG